ncbi:hypothetical protein FOCC_FOCC014535 [Frankliniella occidentalis]|nr:hypothetical protein FOCC_FOCC014535 [Frankliniella occidentalis]
MTLLLCRAFLLLCYTLLKNHSRRIFRGEQKTRRFEKSSLNPSIMGIADMLFKRTSTMALTVIVGAFVFERSFDVLTNTIWDKINEGKQWKDIKKNYES